MLPLIGWLSGDWQEISLITIIPLALMIFTWKIVPESPRFYLTRGKIQEAKEVLAQMAETNGTILPEDIDERLVSIHEDMTRTTAYGYLSLFATLRIAKKTICMTLANLGSSFVFYQLMLNVSNMSGNIFLNFFFLSVIEFPSGIFATYVMV